MTADASKTDPAQTGCIIRGWKVFGPGYHNKTLYTPADITQIAANFAVLSTGEEPWVKAKGKLGHDEEQRLAESLGFPSCGQIVGCRVAADGKLSIDLDGVPLAIGREIKAKRINDGSVELSNIVPQPNDVTQMVPGWVLTGVAFLGEEQPAVPGCPPPEATMPDGSPIPPESLAPSEPWVKKFSAIEKNRFHSGNYSTTFSAGGQKYSAVSVRYSEILAMREQLLSKLAQMGIDTKDPSIVGMSDEQLQAMSSQLENPAFRKAYAQFAKLSDTPEVKTNSADPTEMEKAMSKVITEKLSELEEKMSARLSAVEKCAADLQAKDPEIKNAIAMGKDYKRAQDDLFRQTCEMEIDQCIRRGGLPPVDRQTHVNELMRADRVKKFSAADGKDKEGKTEFQLKLEEYRARKPDARFSAVIPDKLENSGGEQVEEPPVDTIAGYLRRMRGGAGRAVAQELLAAAGKK